MEHMVTKKGVAIPEDFELVLEADSQIRAIFEAMRPSCQRRYVNWVISAKKEETRQRRISRLGEMILDYGQRHPHQRMPV